LLYAIGGNGQSGASVTDHTVYDPAANMWSELAPLPSARNHLAAVSLGGYVYAVGGRSDGGGTVNTGELDRYDPARNEWDVLAPMPTARSGIGAAVFGGRIVVMGGEVNFDNPPTNVFVEVEVYDPATDRWSSLQPMAVPRHGIGAATVGDVVYVPGGATSAGFAATAYSDALRIFP
jgi:N-acetylneuraminic acid mutarotase